MANENTNAVWKGIGITLGIIALAIIGIGLFPGGWLRKLLYPAEPAPSKSGEEACRESHKSLSDGTPCTMCTSGGAAPPKGIIKNGECIMFAEPKPQPAPAQSPAPSPQQVRLRVTNPSGARLYQRDSQGNFVSPRMVQIIPVGTDLIALAIANTTAGIYYQISSGWVSANDVQRTV